jgi:hypothetical protein
MLERMSSISDARWGEAEEARACELQRIVLGY